MVEIHISKEDEKLMKFIVSTMNADCLSKPFPRDEPLTQEFLVQAIWKVGLRQASGIILDDIISLFGVSNVKDGDIDAGEGAPPAV